MTDKVILSFANYEKYTMLEIFVYWQVVFYESWWETFRFVRKMEPLCIFVVIFRLRSFENVIISKNIYHPMRLPYFLSLRCASCVSKYCLKRTETAKTNLSWKKRKKRKHSGNSAARLFHKLTDFIFYSVQ